jgi:hypothetical protein
MVKKTKELSIQELIDLEDQDQTVETGGDFEKTLAPEGDTLARFVEYIELGLQPQRAFKGKEKPPAEMVSLTFELLSPDNAHEYEVDGETRSRNDRVYINVSKKLSGRAKFKKIFEAMRYGRDAITHMKRMLGEAFILTITHTPDKNDPEKIWVNIGTKDSVGIRGPFTVNVKTRRSIPEDVPEATVPLKIFLQEHPTQASWDSLFIDGEYEKDGESVSKNFIQNKILTSPGFEGSALQALLEGTESLPAMEETIEDEETGLEEPAQPNPKGRKVGVVKKATTAGGKTQTASEQKPIVVTKTAAPVKLNTTALTRPAPAPVQKKQVAKKKTSTKDAFAAIGLNVK